MSISTSVVPGPDEVDSLRLLGFETSVIRAVKAHAGERFLPVQRKALEAGLFEGRNLVVMSPTASGKGLVGELACLREAQANRRSMFLVPSRALATEKHRHFERTYGTLGVRAAVSSSDHRRFDGAILRGDYDVAVVVYEKLRFLLVQRPDLLREAGVLVVDELQNLFDEERGPGLEFLLTSVRRQPVQIVGLSAVLGNRETAEWLGAELVMETRRAVELRQGILCDGIFRYREFNSQEEGEEALVGAGEATEASAAAETALYLAERKGESALIFVATREEAFGLAARAAEESSLPAARKALGELEGLEPTAAAEVLGRTLERGVAVHNSDLTAEERRVVEQGVREGEIRIVCATTTLSEGVNLPVINTFVPRRVYRGAARGYEGYGRGAEAVPLLRCEFQNMTGRSGRPGPGEGPVFGRGIMAAGSRAEAGALFRDYVDGALERLPACGMGRRLDPFILEFLAREGPEREEGLVSVFAGSLSGLARPRREVGESVGAALERLRGAGLVRRRDGKWEAEAAGRLAGLHGLGAETGSLFLGFARECDPAASSRLDLLLLAALAGEGESVRIPVGRSEWMQGVLEKEFLRLVDEGEIGRWVARKAGYDPEAGRVGIDYGAAAALKKALLLDGYASGCRTGELEERYQCRLGLVQRAAEQAAWLLRALADVAHFLGWPTPDQGRIGLLAESVRLGLPEEALGLGGLLQEGIRRSSVLALSAAGFDTEEKVRGAKEAAVGSVLSGRALRDLLEWRRRGGAGAEPGEEGAPEASQGDDLVVDPDRPDRMMYRGVEVPLTRIQFRLMEVLWKNRGKCVSYDAIMRSVWEGAIVEQNNVIDQKGRILKKLESLAGKPPRPLIRTVRGRGLLLE